MSRLDDLIKELCPDGVRQYRIDELCEITRGRVMSKDYLSENAGKYPVYSSQTANHGELGRISTYDFDGEFLTWTTDGANAGTVFYRFGKFSITNVCGLLKVRESTLLTRYLYYALSVEAPKYVNSGMGNPKLMSNVMARVTVSIPPMPVQQEIVRILDSFTELTAKLTAELEARKKQYEHYKAKILFSDETETITLDELFDIRNGFTPSKSNSAFWENGVVPWFRMEDIRANGRVLCDALQHVTMEAAKNNPFPANSIIVSTSATIGEHALILCDFLSNQRFTCLTLKKKYEKQFDMKFLFYYCYKLDEYCIANLNQGNFASVDMGKFRKFTFPIISLQDQLRIVATLDRFDALCNDITNGLPAEIAARQKQYEYYRDKLLSFKQLS